MKHPNEEWRPVVGWEGLYEVSDLGRVRSLDRAVKRGRYKGELLRPWTNKGGYSCVFLSGVGRKRRNRQVHSLVAEAFIGPRPKGQVVRHGPLGVVNAISNLTYGTPADNSADRLRDGTVNFGRRNPRCKITECIVREIRNSDESSIQIAKRLPISAGQVRKIRLGISWGHL